MLENSLQSSYKYIHFSMICNDMQDTERGRVHRIIIGKKIPHLLIANTTFFLHKLLIWHTCLLHLFWAEGIYLMIT